MKTSVKPSVKDSKRTTAKPASLKIRENNPVKKQKPKPRKTDSEVGGSKWIESKGLKQIVGHVDAKLHKDLIQISERIGKPLTEIMSELLAKFRDDNKKEKPKAVSE